MDHSTTLAASPTKSLHTLSREDAIERILELESELIEFQESSKDLELALEEELHQLEITNEKLEYRCESLAEHLQIANKEIVRLKKELDELTDTHKTSCERYENEIKNLKSSLVSVEIANDSMEDNDRVLQHKLNLSNQFNNELLEKLAMLENDYQIERKQNLEKNLHIQNYVNEIERLKKINRFKERSTDFSRINDISGLNDPQSPSNNSTLSKLGTKAFKSSTHDLDDESFDMTIEETILSMKEILRSGPPVSKVSTIPKSDSLKKLHELTAKSGELSDKVNGVKKALVPGGLKSPSTTHISKNQQRSKISPSPTMKDIAGSVSNNKSPPHAKIKVMETIIGSPMHNENAHYTRKSKKKRKPGIFESLKALAG